MALFNYVAISDAGCGSGTCSSLPVSWMPLPQVTDKGLSTSVSYYSHIGGGLTG